MQKQTGSTNIFYKEDKTEGGLFPGRYPANGNSSGADL